MAITSSPTRRSSDEPSSAGTRSSTSSTWITARSSSGELPTRVAGCSLPSDRTTVMSPTLPITWALVSTRPSALRTMPGAGALEDALRRSCRSSRSVTTDGCTLARIALDVERAVARGDRGEHGPVDRGRGVVVEGDGDARWPRARRRGRRPARRAAPPGGGSVPRRAPAGAGRRAAAMPGGSATGPARGGRRLGGAAPPVGRRRPPCGAARPARVARAGAHAGQRLGRARRPVGRLEVGRSHGSILASSAGRLPPRGAGRSLSASLQAIPGTKSGSGSVEQGRPPERQAPPNGPGTRVDGPRALHEHPALHVLPERRRRGGGGPEDLRDLPGAGGVPRARPREPHRPRRVGWLLGARATPDPQAPPDAEPRSPSRSASGRRGRQAFGSASSSSVGAFLEALLELVLRLAQRPGQLRQLRAAEEHQDDEQDDEQLWTTEVGTGSTVPADPAERHRARLQVRGSAGARVRRQHQRGTRRRPPRAPSPRSPAPTCSTCTPTPTTTARCSPSSARTAPRAPRHDGRRAPRPPATTRAPTRAWAWSTSFRSCPSTASTSDDAHRGARRVRHVAGRRRTSVPCFVYGPERSLPDVRRHAFRDLAPDVGPAVPSPHRRGHGRRRTRTPLVAFNVWMAEPGPRGGAAGGGGRSGVPRSGRWACRWATPPRCR